ncbi:hypothetical protein [Burkholderia ubonensis]|uniref:hypothetical protein n=1 Tax=Burkholderia ubonensis TaxID=101571 RepID=UPI000AEC898E|nr:hypothetical protein [Burkholderia ubonensis]
MKAHWLWELTGSKGERHGYVQAIDPRDAVSRAFTSNTESGRLLGDELGPSTFDILHDAPGNFDSEFAGTGDGFTIRVKRVSCPTTARHSQDIVGCGSANVNGPDEEGLFDCSECGLFFNPRTAA